MRRALVLAGSLTVALAATPALATHVLIEDFIGVVSIVEGADNVEVLREGKDALDMSQGETVRIIGGYKRPAKEKVCDSYASGFTLSINGRDRMGGDKAARRHLKDYPELRVFVPEGSNVTVKNSILQLDTDVALSDADLDLVGCFDTTLTDVLDLKINKSGSGDLSARAVGAFALSKAGSGSVEIEDAGAVTVRQSGSGEMDFGRIGRSLSVKKSGSGDIEVGELFGTFELSQSGSGDVDIEGGAIERVVIRKSGSGEVEIDAEVGDAELRSSGSGDIEILRVTGTLKQRTSGSGEVSIGD